MYRCEITKKLSRPGAKLIKVVATTRPQTYYKYIKNEESRLWEKVFAATGWEIVREISVSEEGATIWQNWSPEEKDAFLKGMSSR